MDLSQMTDLLSSLMASQAKPAAEATPPTETAAETPPAADASAQDLGPLIDMAMKAAPALLSSLSESGTDLSGLMQSLLGGGSKDTQTEQPATEAVKTSAPVDLSAVANAVKALGLPGGSSTTQNVPNFKTSNQKTQLLRALKPYMNPRRAGKIDRAISMLDTAYTARTALKLFTKDNKQGS